ncbi:hypothetical protein L1077_26230 [Pseudoalteromonas luteoviolacea]|uniref:hypothetical protein n=1 Tax=Pseudoalteromonas luteoviolacea TaxID=43657 RepID=UPI001F3CC8AB|nr:hypothetical protein [Pseudoalteromonas luteoviolacea]MCF6442926.1 hypothetical protein [Pseudoalteromonas luteoviolacea]
MFWKKKSKYMFPHDYSYFTEGLFSVCDLEHAINFIEVCNQNGLQHCIKRQAKMLELLANENGDLFFLGYCNELKQERVFELLVSEYEIDGRLQVINDWFFKVTGRTKYSFTQECHRRSARLQWKGKCLPTTLIDVCVVTEKGYLKEVCVMREFDELVIYSDFSNRFYIEFLDMINKEKVRTYPMALKFTTEKSTYNFEEWCKSIISIDIWKSIPPE